MCVVVVVIESIVVTFSFVRLSDSGGVCLIETWINLCQSVHEGHFALRAHDDEENCGHYICVTEEPHLFLPYVGCEKMRIGLVCFARVTT